MTNFKFQKFSKLLLLSSVIVLVAASCGKQQDENLQLVPIQKETQTVSPQTTAPSPPDPKAQTQKSAGLSVQQTVAGKQTTNTFVEGQTALDLLKVTYKIETKNFSGIGEFVESVDGVKPDSSHFWKFYVNGKSSNVGAGGYKLQNGDQIMWELAEIE